MDIDAFSKARLNKKQAAAAAKRTKMAQLQSQNSLMTK